MDEDYGLLPLGASPTIDVVIPARNRAHFLPACLDSILAQTLQPDTVFVIDDGSTDRTKDVLAQYQEIWPGLEVIRTDGVGVSAARNLALARSGADLIAFLDSDDIWDSTMLEALTAKFLAGQPDLGLVNCGFRQIDAQGQRLPNIRDAIPGRRGDVFSAVLDDFYGIAPSTLMVRRDAILRVGGFDETLAQAEDRDLCLKLARSYAGDYVPDVLVGLRQHQGNTYRQAMLHDPEFVLMQRLQVWNRWLAEITKLDAVISQFRADAISAGRFAMLRKGDFKLYGRLRASDMELARRLFGTRRSYWRAILPLPWGTRSASATPASARLKAILAIQVIAPNKWLLRLVQRFGRLQGWESTPRAPRTRRRVK